MYLEHGAFPRICDCATMRMYVVLKRKANDTSAGDEFEMLTKHN